MFILRYSNGKGDVWWKIFYKCRVLIIFVFEFFKMLIYMYLVFYIGIMTYWVCYIGIWGVIIVVIIIKYVCLKLG